MILEAKICQSKAFHVIIKYKENREVITIPTKNNFNINNLYYRFKVCCVNEDTKEKLEFDDIFEAANYIKDSRATKASRSALRRGIFKASNPDARRGKYLGYRWITIGENVYSREAGIWLHAT